MAVPYALDAHMAAEQMLLPAQGKKRPLLAIGHLQDELEAFLHQPAFQYDGAVSGHGLIAEGGVSYLGKVCSQSLKTLSRCQARKCG